MSSLATVNSFSRETFPYKFSKSNQITTVNINSQVMSDWVFIFKLALYTLLFI